MGRCRHLAALVLLVLWGAGPVAAQPPSLGGATITQDSEMSSAQQQEINRYATYYVEQLCGGDRDTVGNARIKLVEPLYKGGSQYFNTAYSTAVSSRLINCAQAEKDLVRINVMIVTSRLIDPGVIPLIEAGLADPNAAVRYWAAKAAQGDEEAKTLARKLYPEDSPNAKERRNAAEKRILDAMRKAASKELEPWVLQQILQVLVNLETPTALPVVVEVLHKRFEGRMTAPTDGMDDFAAEAFGVKRLAQKVVYQTALKSEIVTPELLKNTSALLYRYGNLASSRLAEARLPDGPELSPDTAADLRSIRADTDDGLRFIASKLTPSVDLPQKPTNQADVKYLEIFVSDWPRVLDKMGVEKKRYRTSSK